MNRKVLVGLLLVLGGCVPSLHPLYTEKDLIFDPALLGEWTLGKNNKESWTFTKAGEKQYQLVYIDDEGKEGKFCVHLLKIEGRLFLDLFPMELDSKKTDEDPKENAFYKLHLVPAHTFMLVKQIQPTLQMAFLNPSWAKDYLKAHPDAVRHEKVDHDEIVLTAPTKELQAFVLKHEKDADAFATLDPMTRKADAKR